MTNGKILFLIPYFVSLAISIGVLIYTSRRRNVQGAVAFAWCGMGQVLWITSFILELLSTDINAKIFWDGLQWFASFLYVIAIPIFAIHYTQYKISKPRLFFWLSLIVPSVFLLLLFSNQTYHLIYTNTRLASNDPFAGLLYNFTPAVYGYAFYVYAITLWVVYKITRYATRPYSIYRVQAALIILGLLIPVIGTVVTLLDLHIASQLHVTPFTTAIGMVILALGLFRFRVFNVMHFARDRVFEAMVEPVVILDNQANIVDVNFSMLSLLGKTATEVIGAQAKDVFADFPIPIKLYSHVSYANVDATVELGGLITHYELTVWPLYNSDKEIIGRVYISHDVTKNKELEKDLRKLNAHLEDRVRARTWELEEAYDTTLEGWARALELRDKETEGHSRRVTENTIKIAMAMGINGEYLEHLRRGALLHDIGKMGIPDEILHKPDKLSEEEREIIRQHPVTAYNLLSPIQFLNKAMEIPYCHHEKWDGSGYPRGLKEHAIPMSARIFAVADVWDALTVKRAYNDAWTHEETIAYLIQQAGVYFDPRIVNIFLELLEKGEIQ